MSRQKCDYLTLEERGGTLEDERLLYADERIERKAFEAVAAEWNRRQPNDKAQFRSEAT